MPEIHLPPEIFKAYDIRGIVGRTLTPAIVRTIGQGLGTLALEAGRDTIVVGRDGRLSGPELAKALSDGIRAAGANVIDVGMVATPMSYFAAHHLGTQSSTMVTGSHNPPDYNGLKMVINGDTLSGEAIQSLRRRLESDDVRRGSGTYRTEDIGNAYIDRIASDVKLARPMKVVLDCGNGIGGASAPKVLRAIGCDVTELFCAVDGRFPNHHPDPGDPANLQDLIARVRESGAELGLALDGDGDRLGVVTRGGHVIYPDRQLMLLARDALSRVPGAAIVFDVKSTQRLPEVIAAAGGRPVMGPSGYVLVKQRMIEAGAPVAGEMSGHVFFRERWYGFDDGTYAACRLLEILSQHDDASAVLDALPESCSTPELHVPCAEGEAHEVARGLAAIAEFPGAQVCTVDGLRVDWPDGFGLVRASNTNPVLTVRFEGHTREAMRRIEREMMQLLRRVKPDARIASH